MPRTSTLTRPPDLRLSGPRQEELALRVRQLLYRWQPRTEDPNALAREVYELLEWVRDDDEPTCPLLQI